MIDNLNADELQAREDDISSSAWNENGHLMRWGIIPTRDKAFSLYKWQLEQIDAAKAALEPLSLGG